MAAKTVEDLLKRLYVERRGLFTMKWAKALVARACLFELDILSYQLNEIDSVLISSIVFSENTKAYTFYARSGRDKNSERLT